MSDGSGQGYQDVTVDGVSVTATVNYVSGIFNLATPPATGIGNVEIAAVLGYTDILTSTAVYVTSIHVGDGTSLTFPAWQVSNPYWQNLATADNYVAVSTVVYTSGAASAGYTVDYLAGEFTLTTAPASGQVIEITATEPQYERNQINHCSFATPYGQGSGNAINVYMAGNSSYPSRMWWSAQQDPSYFPASSYVDIDIKNDPIIGFLGHSNSMLIFKERVIYTWDGALPDVSIKEIFRNEGCIATDSLQVVNGYPTFMSQRGVVQLQVAQVGYKLELISEQVNGIVGKRNGIMTETYENRKKCIGFMDDKRYYLWLNGKIWVYEYNLTQQGEDGIVYPWIPWQSFPNLNAFSQRDGLLYFAGTDCSSVGHPYVFDTSAVNDNGHKISSYWLSKNYHVGETYDWIKVFQYQYFHMRSYSNISTSVVTCITYVEGDGGWATATSTTTGVSGTAIYTYHMVESASASIASAVLNFTMSPSSALAFIEYDKRSPIHYKGRSVQFSVSENTTGGAFSLMGTKIQFSPERKSIR